MRSPATLNYTKKVANFQADILFIFPPPWGVDVPPLGVASLSTFLRSKGFHTEIFDLNIELYNIVPDEHRYLWNMNYGDWWHDEDRYPTIREELANYIEHLMEKVVRFPQKVIGISLPTNCPDLISEEIVKRIKEKDSGKIIILGGLSISIKEQRIGLLKRVENFVDYCVLGEGEQALQKLLEKIAMGKFAEVENIKGVLTRKNFYNTNLKAQIKNWEDIPFPTFEEFELKKYDVKGESLPIEFSRGCIGRCPFCDFRSISPLFKVKSSQYILKQIEFYLERYKINHLTVLDAAVNSDVKKLENICDLLIEKKVDVRMSALAIPRKEMNYRLLSRMSKAGFYRLEYGLESGSDKILRAMRKIFTARIARQVIQDTYWAGIKNILFLMVGYPGETKNEFNETKRFLEENAKYITMIRSINPLYVMAGSEIFYNPQKYNIVLPSNHADREWYIGNENTYDIRKDRVLELKRFVRNIGIAFSEETEALEFTLDTLNRSLKECPSSHYTRSVGADKNILADLANILREAFLENKVIRKKRSMFKWLILFCVSIYAFIYIVYFWIYMILKNKVLLGGRKK